MMIESSETVLQEYMDSALRYLAQNDLERAMFEVKRAIEKDDNFLEAYHIRGLIFMRHQQFQDALHDFNFIITHDPENVTFLYERAYLMMFMGSGDEALKDIECCLGINPDFVAAYSLRAGFLYRRGQLGAALENLEKALSLEPGNSGYLHNMAVIYSAMGRYNEAIALYLDVLAKHSDNGGTLNNLAWIYATARDSEIRDGEKALHYALRAVKIGRNAAWLDTLAAAYAEYGDYEKAVEVEREAYALSAPPNESFSQRIEQYILHKSNSENKEKTDEADNWLWNKFLKRLNEVNTMLNSERLKGLNLFSYLRSEQVDKISTASEVMKLKAGEKVYEKGDKATHFYIVLKGKIALLFKTTGTLVVPIDELDAGVMFGSCACFSMDSYFLTAKSVSDSEVLKIQTSVLQQIMEEDIHIGFAIQKKISEVYFKRYIAAMKQLRDVVYDLKGDV